MKKLNYLFLCVLVISLSLLSCQKQSSNSTVSVKMTDAPGPYTAVYIDLQGVEITGTNNNTVLLNTNNKIYNLLNFTNGKDTLIGTGSLSEGSVEQIRLILGPNNTVVINNISYPLSVPSADQTGLKLQVHQSLVGGVAYSFLLDFDANQSIVDNGDGNYKLKPVIRTIDKALTGSIMGKISPVGILATVTATSALATYSSNVSVTGDFLVEGLPAGLYTITVTPALPNAAVIETNMDVEVGASTNVGTITIL